MVEFEMLFVEKRKRRTVEYKQLYYLFSHDVLSVFHFGLPSSSESNV